MNHLYPNGSSTECSRSVATVTYACRVVGILRDDKQRRNTFHRKSNCKSFSLGKSRLEHRTKSRSQCKFRVQEINSFVFLFLLLNFFLLVRATPFFILPDIGVNKGLAKRYVGGRIPKVWSASDHRYVLHSFKIKRTRRNANNF